MDDKKKPIWSWGPAKKVEPVEPVPVPTIPTIGGPSTVVVKKEDRDDWWWDRYSFDHRSYSYDSTKGSASWRSRLGMVDDDSWDFPGWGGSKAKRSPDYMYSKALNQLQGSANIIGGMENRSSVRWSNGSSRNSPTDPNVYVSPDGLLDEAGKLKDEAIDALTGKVYMASTLRETVSPTSHQEARASRAAAYSSDVDDAAIRLWEAMETSIARHSILENWGGFASYIAKDEEITIAPKSEVQEYLNQSEAQPNATAASVAVAWNLLHPHDRVRVPDCYDPVLDLVAKALTEEIPAEERFRRSKDLAEKIVALLAPPKDEQPEPPPDEDEEEEDSSDNEDNEGSSDEEEEESSQEGDEKDKVRGGVPKVTDSAQFGGNVKNEVDVDLHKQVPEKGDKDSAGRSVSTDFDGWGDETSETTFVAMAEHLNGDMAGGYRNVRAHLSASIRMVRDALFFHHNEMHHPTYGHLSGDVDEGNLFKLSLGDDRVMLQNEVEARRSIAICLLVDESGSMHERERYEQARDVAIILAEGLSQITGITVDVYGHTAEVSHSGTHIKEYRSPRCQRNETMMMIEAMSENHDGYAIQHVANRFHADHPYVDKKLMFVISDGAPLGSWYRGEKAIAHVAEVVRQVRAKLMTQVYGIGVDRAYEDRRGREMYGEGNFVVLNDVASAAPLIARFVRQVAAAMKRKVA